MKRKVIAMVLLVVIAAGMLTGCGAVSSATKTAADAAPGNKAEATYVAPESPAEEYVETECEAAVEYEPAENSYATDSASKEYSGAAMDYATEELAEMWPNPVREVYTVPSAAEKYAGAKENETVSVVENALSTFAADVDTASYTNLRRMIEDGYDLDSIPADAVRTEEIVNYFKYHYAEPKDGNVFGVNAQVSACPWNKEAKLMTLGVNTAIMDSRDIPDCNIVFLIDVSGSMRGENKLPLIQKTMAMLCDRFDENDRISIVTYASGVETVLSGCKGNDSRKIMKAFESLKAGGSTNGGDGIKKAYKLAEKYYMKNGVNRVIVCSDGDFNVGLTTAKELEDMISAKKDTGIFLSTLGFGMGNYSDVTMETLADKGNGNYAYIDDLTEAKRVLVDEMTSTFVTVAKDVKLQVEFNPAVVSQYRLVGYENRSLNAQDFKDDTKDGGEMGAGHQVTAIYEIYTAAAEEETELKYQENKLSAKGEKGDEYCTLSIAYKEPDGEHSNYLEYPIGVECYAENPNDDFKLAAAAAQASLAFKNSEYLKDITREKAIKSSVKIARNLEKTYEDEYIGEFGDLLEQVTAYNWF